MLSLDLTGSREQYKLKFEELKASNASLVPREEEVVTLSHPALPEPPLALSAPSPGALISFLFRILLFLIYFSK